MLLLYRWLTAIAISVAALPVAAASEESATDADALWIAIMPTDGTGRFWIRRDAPGRYAITYYDIILEVEDCSNSSIECVNIPQLGVLSIPKNFADLKKNSHWTVAAYEFTVSDVISSGQNHPTDDVYVINRTGESAAMIMFIPSCGVATISITDIGEDFGVYWCGLLRSSL